MCPVIGDHVRFHFRPNEVPTPISLAKALPDISVAAKAAGSHFMVSYLFSVIFALNSTPAA
jgi:hypothetical protein